jgi:hypothetical protein
MARPPVALIEKVRQTLEDASDAMWDRAEEISLPTLVKRYRPGRFEYSEAALKDYLATAYLDLRMLAELLGQSECLADIKRFEGLHSPKFGQVHYDAEYDHVYATGLDEAGRFLKSLLAAAGHPVAGAVVTPFENILRSTAKIVHASKIAPTNEKDVRDAVYPVLRYAYPDTTRVGGIPTPGKTYIPDFTSKDAQSVAEYKFARNATDLAKIYDEISSDILGYSADPAIRFKFAVVYLTSAFASQADADAHFKIVGMPEDWTIIIQN